MRTGILFSKKRLSRTSPNYFYYINDAYQFLGVRYNICHYYDLPHPSLKITAIGNAARHSGIEIEIRPSDQNRHRLIFDHMLWCRAGNEPADNDNHLPH